MQTIYISVALRRSDYDYMVNKRYEKSVKYFPPHPDTSPLPTIPQYPLTPHLKINWNIFSTLSGWVLFAFHCTNDTFCSFENISVWQTLEMYKSYTFRVDALRFYFRKNSIPFLNTAVLHLPGRRPSFFCCLANAALFCCCFSWGCKCFVKSLRCS